MLKDPTGLGTFDWFWDLFKEKTPEEITTKGLAAGFATQCIAQNCVSRFTSTWTKCLS